MSPQVTIVIKYFFQFGFFPFNQKLEVDRSKPFHPPNILGVEKKEGYVLYDLLQLLALFYHRAILKRHGLWDQTVAMETGDGPEEHGSAAAAAAAKPADAPDRSVRRRGRRRTQSGGSQQASVAGRFWTRTRTRKPGLAPLAGRRRLLLARRWRRGGSGPGPSAGPS